jgi:hypothetical protein
MRARTRPLLLTSLALLLAFAGEALAGQQARTADVVRRWNSIAIDASGLDHTPPVPPETRDWAEQIGPGRASRAMAIVHLAIFEAVNAIAGGHQSTVGLRRAARDTSFDAAVATAAADTLAALYPAQADAFRDRLARDLARIQDRRARLRGVALGREAAAALLTRSADDGADHPERRYGVDYLPSDEPGSWRQDPISLHPLALGADWGHVEPFAIRSGEAMRVPPPPALTSPAYAAAFAEVKALGGDGVHTLTARTPEQTHIGIFWAYDGTPSLCAPPRLYNQVTVQIADQRRVGPVALARLLALVNVALSDASIAAWESKYHYRVWRPVTGIREADEGGGPSGLGDGNPATLGDPGFMPLGAPASNLAGPNFTPPFPAYPSGHASLGGALFQVLRHFFGRDDVAFSFVSDEFNGVTRDNRGNVRPLLPRRYRSFSQAEEENGQSRIYLGIHWAFDKTRGIEQGRRVANQVVRRIAVPKRW